MNSNFLIKVTELVLTKRRELGLSQEDVARHLVVDTSFVSNVEAYRKHYNLDHINELANLFNCSPRDLIPEIYIKEKL
jgi:ribosome-binding protein aMBF1 (putative translation factor)